MEFSSSPRFGVVSHVLTHALVASLVVGAGILTLRFLGPLPLSVTQTVTQKESAFQVSGKSEITTVPNQVTVRMGVVSSANTVAKAQDRANDTITMVIDELGKLSIPKDHIQTSNYTIYPEYDYSSGASPRITGYRVDAQLTVKVLDFEKLNQVIDTATTSGANQIGGIEFGLTKEKREELMQQAREEAIADAKNNASELAQLAGLNLGRVIDVSETPQDRYNTPMHDVALMTKESGGGGEPTQIEPGSTTFIYQVTLSYETL